MHDESEGNAIHDMIAPENMPHPVQPEAWKKAEDKAPAKSGVSVAYLTIDNIEHALDFSKRLFKEGLVSAVQMQEGDNQREYLKFGRMHSDANRVRMEMTTSTEKVTALIDYCNHHNPTPYDYPVPDITVLPVSGGNKDYLEFIKESTEKGKKVKLDDDETNVNNGEEEYEEAIGGH
jgi:uncharacterized protein involved in tolerance to divalent cations